ncbi:LysR family transcriptional regulator [Cohnella faecalis]|uniref:LysR family transcriptional regulator n=1 Tax=Cohnella faecalis TaxID=2315694 RepID=A0A398CUU2_9BACL|nr:LysR family transcriptional regulator [Cohnella faecalis]RIE05029.1 LysR family transcriptional regulator [Cohnella faecalis]
MEIRLIKTFLTIVKLGSFHEAAKALQYSQPTITVQVKKLEDELGIKLFERGKTTELTSAGRFFLQKAEKLLNQYDEFENELRDYRDGDAGIIRIGISEPSASNRFPAILSSFALKRPKVQIKVSIGSNKGLVDMLLNEEIDLAFCNRPEPHIELSFEHLLTETFGLLLPADHPLADLDKLHILDLKDEKFIMTPGTCPFRIRVEEAIAEKIGMLRQSSIEITGINSLKYFVQAKLGIALAPLVSISPPITGTVVKAVSDMIAGPDLGILTKKEAKGRSLVLTYLTDEIRRVSGEVDLESTPPLLLVANPY